MLEAVPVTSDRTLGLGAEGAREGGKQFDVLSEERFFWGFVTDEPVLLRDRSKLARKYEGFFRGKLQNEEEFGLLC